MSILLLRGSATSSSLLTGLDFDGNPSAVRMLYWHSVPDMYPFTLMAKGYIRSNSTISRTDGSRYGTLFFWGNDGNGTWQSSQNNSYWGIEPYPVPAGFSPGPWKFEIACYNKDYVDRDDGSSPFITNDQWYSTAIVCSLSGSQSSHKAWINLPSTTTANKIHSIDAEQSPVNWGAEPPQRALFFGQSPPHPDFPVLSWGGYYGWDEINGIIRGIIMITAALTEAQVVALSAFDHDADVIAYLSGQGLLGSLWYLNMNPTPTDVTDKSGNGHHGSWNHASNRPALWTN